METIVWATMYLKDIKVKALPHAMLSWWSGRKIWKAFCDTCLTCFLFIFCMIWVWLPFILWYTVLACVFVTWEWDVCRICCHLYQRTSSTTIYDCQYCSAGFVCLFNLRVCPSCSIPANVSPSTHFNNALVLLSTLEMEVWNVTVSCVNQVKPRSWTSTSV